MLSSYLGIGEAYILRHLMFLLAAVLTLSLAACSQDTPVEQAEEEAGVEEIVEEETTTPYQAPARNAEEAASDEAKKKAAQQGSKAKPSGEARDQAGQVSVEDLDPIIELLACQLSEVAVTLSPEEANALDSEMIEAVPSQSPNLQTFLANRGFTCGGRAEEILAMTPEERIQMSSDEKIELSMYRQRMEAEELSKMHQD